MKIFTGDSGIRTIYGIFEGCVVEVKTIENTLNEVFMIKNEFAKRGSLVKDSFDGVNVVGNGSITFGYFV